MNPEAVTEGTKLCGCRWRNKRFYYAAVIAFTVMAMGIVAIIAIVGTMDKGALLIIYLLIDFSVVLVFLLMFGLLDHFCCADDPVSTKEPKGTVANEKGKATERTADVAIPMESTSPLEVNHADCGTDSTADFATTAQIVTINDGGCVTRGDEGRVISGDACCVTRGDGASDGGISCSAD